jgi:hypothetical protein
VAELERTITELREREVTVAVRFEIPHGPGAELTNPGPQRIAIYQLTRPEASERIADYHYPVRVGVPMTSARRRRRFGASVARREESGTMSRWGWTDEQLLGRLLAPPDLDDGVESLDYWSRRSRRLPWYRIRARREAVRMTVRWEQRVGAALVSQHRAPVDARFLAGVLIARTRLARWTRRAGIAVLAVVTAVVVIATLSTAAALVTLVNAF